MQFRMVNKNIKTFRRDISRSCLLLLTMHCGVFQMEFTSRWTLTSIMAMTMRFSPHTKERKLTLKQINRRWRKRDVNTIKGRWHLRFFFLCWKSSQKKLSLSYSSLQCTLVASSKSFYVACMKVVLSLNWKLFLSLITTALCVPFLCTGFCRWSLRSELQELMFCFTSIHN